MGPNLELKGKPEAALEVLVNKEDILAPPFSGPKVLQSALPIEQTPLSSGNEDLEVNITECTKSSEALMMEDTCEDDTECSSSFGDTGSGTENGSAFSDDEVVSSMYASNQLSSMFYQWCEPSLMRRKKLTNHWRSFIRPLMWRCKWIELKLKQLQSQALKYEKELAACDYRKQHVFANFALDGFDTESVPLSGQICGEKVMKRKKRRRVEQTCNLASYMSDHIVFSYYENRDAANGTRLKDVSGVAKGNPEKNEDFKWNDILSSLDSKDSDKSLEIVIRKIEAVRSRVHKLRTRIDKLVEKTKESVEEQKSVSLAQASEPDLAAKNDVPNLLSSLKACSASKPNVSWSWNTRRARQKSGSKRRSRR